MNWVKLVRLVVKRLVRRHLIQLFRVDIMNTETTVENVKVNTVEKNSSHGLSPRSNREFPLPSRFSVSHLVEVKEKT